MEFGLSEEQVLLKDNLHRYLESRAGLDRVREHAEQGEAEDVWQGLTELGVPALMVPEAFGGVGLSTLDAAVVAEMLGFHTTPAPFIPTAVLVPLALAHAPDDVRARVLPEIAQGTRRAGLAISHAIARRGSRDPDRPVGIDSDGNRLTGCSPFVIDARSDCVLVADNGRALYLVDRGAEGFEMKPLATVDTTRHIGELTLESTPATRLSSDPNLFADVVDAARVMLAADTLGAAKNMLDQAVAYAKQREQFNRPIGSFQAVKHMCAEMAAELEPCRALVWYAAHALARVPDESRLTACHTKAHLAEVGTFVARTATEVHGGMGFTDLLGLHYWFKRIGLNRQLLGTPELVRADAAAVQGLT